MTTQDESRTDWERQPPQDVDAEVSVLGAMLLSKDAIADVVQELHVTDFYRPAHQTIYEAILSLYVNGDPADPVTVSQRLGKDLQRIGGAGYLAHLITTVPTAASAGYYATMVAEAAGMRRLVEAGTRIVQYGYAGADGADAEEVKNRAQQEIYDATRGNDRTELWGMSRSLNAAMDELQMIAAGAGMGGVPTGYRDLDRLVHSLHPGELIIVAGRPAMGKSTIGLDFLRECCITQELPGVLFSLEMSRNEVMMRLLSAEARVDLNTMRAGRLSDEEWSALSTRMGEISDRPLFVDDTANMTMMEIRAKARRLKQQHDLRLVVVDYLQLMTSGKRVESRQQEVSEISRQCKVLAKELELPVVALSQLNRNPESRADKRPMLSDLRESGSLEQDADMVMLVNRPEVYEKDSPRAGEADLILAKHRNGPTGEVTLAAQLHQSRFANMAPEWRETRW